MKEAPISIDPQTDHATLVAAVAAGSRRAESEIYRRYNSSMQNSLRRYANNPMDGEDWLSASWVVALTKLRAGALRQPEALPGFLCGVARRVAAGELRRCWNHALRLPNEELETLALEDDTSSVAAARELVEISERLVEDMPVPRDRELLRRCYLQDEDRESVAADLDLEATAFSKTLHRARKRLWAKAETTNTAGSLRAYLVEGN
ncbi:MAG: sigma-70 family RNA polymerase sigma factor [Pseudomonadota bacterium]